MKLSSGKKFHEGTVSVTTVASTGTVAVSFPDAFVNKPAVMVIPPMGYEGNYVADATTTTGFTVSVGAIAGSSGVVTDGLILGNAPSTFVETALNFSDATYSVGWIAAEKL